MSIRPIAAPRLFRRIADEIARLIDAGEFAPGERLPGERELAKKLGVSRSSLREALSALEIAGRVRIKVGSGVYVTGRGAASGRGGARDEMSPFDVLRARSIVESETAALAARHATPAQLARIGAAFTRLAREMRGEGRSSAGDREFHLRIAEASGNVALAALVRSLWERHRQPVAARLESLFVTSRRRRDNVAEHAAILDAIRSRNAAAARTAMRRHLRNAERQRLALLRQRG